MISGNKAGPMAVAVNSTWAMGTPVAMLFLDPQNTMVISSSLLKPSARAIQVVATSTTANNTQQTSVSVTSVAGGTASHRPPTTEALKAVYTTSKIELWSMFFSQDWLRSIQAPIQGRNRWPTTKGNSSWALMFKMASSMDTLPVAEAVLVSSSSCSSKGVSTMPSRLMAEAMQMAAGTLPRAMAVNAMADCTVPGRAHKYSIPT